MLAALLAAAGWAAAGSAAHAQATNIDTAQPFYLTSNLGVTVNPVFQGGVLKVDQANGSYSQNFTLAGSGSNTLDQGGQTSTFTGAFSDAVNGVPGSLGFINSGSGGGVTLSGFSTYTGATTIGDGVTLSLSSTGHIDSSSVVSLLGATSVFDVSNAALGTQVRALSGVAGSRVRLGAKGLTVNHTTATIFAGVISGSGADAFIKSGSGIQTLSGVNTYTNATSITDGVLALSGLGSIASSSSVDIGTGATLDISAATAGASVTRLTGSGFVVLGGQTLTLTGASNDTYGGVISGSGGLTIAAGSQTLTGVSTYSGQTTIANGATLALSGAGNIAASSGIALSGTLDISATAAGATTGSLSGGGHVILGGETLTIAQGSGTFSGDIAGTGGLVVSGGIQVLSGANTYTGGTTVTGGVLLLSGGGTLGDASAPVTVSGGVLDLGGTTQNTGLFTLDGGALVDSSGQGRLNASAFDLRSGFINGVLGGVTDLTKSGSGAIVLSAANTYTGATTITGGDLVLTGAGAIATSSQVVIDAGARLDISSTNAGASLTRLSGAGAVVLGDRTLTLTNASDRFSGVIGGAGGLMIAGGAETLTGANSYTGATTIAGPATLSLADAGSIAASSGVVANGTLDISATGVGASVASLSGSGRVVLGGETLTLTNASGRFDGIISGSGGVTIRGGEEVLTGANSYTGPTRIAGAAVGVTTNAALGSTQSSLVLDNGALVILHDLSLARPIQVASGGGAIHVDGVAVSLDGPIALDGVLGVHGAGTVRFTGVARGGGALSIADGVFFQNGDISAQGVTVAAGATLRGAGVINAPTTVSGTLAPGNSPGTLTFNAPVTLQASATSQFDIDGSGTSAGAGNFSRVVINGADGRLTAGGILAPRLRGITGSASNTFTPALGQQFQIISAAGGIAANSGFSGLIQPAGLAAGTRFDALYSAQAISLVATPAAYGDLPSAGVTQTANERAVGLSLDTARPAAGLRMTPDQAAIYYPLYSRSAAEIPGALDALSPDIYADSLMAARQAWDQGSISIADQLAGRRDAPDAAKAAAGDVMVWGDIFGQATRFSGPDEDARASTGGLIFGVDRRFGGGLLGVALGIDDVRTDAAGGDHAEGQMVQASVYGDRRLGGAFVDWRADYLRMDQHLTRTGGPFGTPARGSNRLEGAGIQVNAGVDLTVRQWLVEPTMGLSGLHLWSTAASEAANSAMAEQVNAQHNDSLQTFTGVRLARAVRLTPNDISVQIRGFAGWSHELEDVQAEARGSLTKLGGPAFIVTSAPTGRDAVKLGASLSAQVTSKVTAFGAYGADLARHRESQHVTLGVRAVW